MPNNFDARFPHTFVPCTPCPNGTRLSEKPYAFEAHRQFAKLLAPWMISWQEKFFAMKYWWVDACTVRTPRQAVAGHASAPSRGRAAVCRLRRAHDRRDRPLDRRIPHGTAVCRHPRGLELYLCGGDLDAIAAGLDREPCARLRLFRRGDGADRVRQPEGRGHQGLLLRPCDQPDLWGSGRALRHGRGAGAAAQTKG